MATGIGADSRRGMLPPPQRSPWTVARDLYRARGTFRGFVEFAVIGAVVLSFLPGGLDWLNSGWLRSLMPGQAAQPLQAPPNNELPKPSRANTPLVPRISDLKIEPSYFDQASEPLRGKLVLAL